jgi:hypothetical protein
MFKGKNSMNPKLKSVLLLVALALLAIGIFKPNLDLLNRPASPSAVVQLDVKEPESVELRKKADIVIKALSVNSDRKKDGFRLAQLYNDMATLIALDGKDEVIKNTEEIRQANRLTGAMLKLDIKGKYEDLPEAAQDLVLTAIGDDNVLLNEDLREKAVQGFKALSWACLEGSK